MAFKPKVTTFAQVTNKLTQIGKYLGSVNAALKALDWTKLPKKRRRRKKGKGGTTDAGSKPPKPWPP